MNLPYLKFNSDWQTQHILYLNTKPLCPFRLRLNTECCILTSQWVQCNSFSGWNIVTDKLIVSYLWLVLFTPFGVTQAENHMTKLIWGIVFFCVLFITFSNSTQHCTYSCIGTNGKKSQNLHVEVLPQNHCRGKPPQNCPLGKLSQIHHTLIQLIKLYSYSVSSKRSYSITFINIYHNTTLL